METLDNIVSALAEKIAQDIEAKILESMTPANSTLPGGKGKIKEFEDLPQILTPQIIADYYGISRSKVYELMKIDPKYGGIESWKVGNRWKTSREKFGKWLAMESGQKFEKTGRPLRLA